MSYDKFTYSTEDASILLRILRENPDRPAEGMYSKDSLQCQCQVQLSLSLFISLLIGTVIT